MKLTIILLICGAVNLVCNAATEKYQKTEDGSQYFMEFQGRYNWYEAVYACARKNMSLITMDTKDKMEQIKKLLKFVTANTEPWLWLAGRSNNGYTRQYYWLATGQSMAYSNWAKGEPSIGDDENCVAIWSKEGEWNNVPCDMSIGYICEDNFYLKTKAQELLALKTSYELEIQNLKSTPKLDEKNSCEDVKAEIRRKHIEEENEMKSMHEKALQDLRDKCHKTNKESEDGGGGGDRDRGGVGDSDNSALENEITKLRRDKKEVELKLSECLKTTHANGSTVTNKYYNLILNVSANAQQLKLMGYP